MFTSFSHAVFTFCSHSGVNPAKDDPLQIAQRPSNHVTNKEKVDGGEYSTTLICSENYRNMYKFVMKTLTVRPLDG